MSVTPQTAEDRAAKWRKSGLRKWILALGLVVTIVDVGLIFLPFVPASWNFLRDCDSSSVVVGDPAARQPNKSTIEQHCSPELPSTGIVTLGLGLLGLLVLIELANTLPNFRVKALAQKSAGAIPH
ncbi:MAG: hypothetical protein WDM88_13180 [Galbitalea sp.]